MGREDWMALVAEALRDPRRNAQRILGWPLPERALGLALLLVSVLAVLGLYGMCWAAGALAGHDVALQVVAMVLMAALRAGDFPILSRQVK
jgi:hypothetical protein